MPYPTYPAAAALVLLALPVQAAQYRYHPHPHLYAGEPSVFAEPRSNGGHGSGPYWQGEPTDYAPIWRNGYYQGNDPDQFIRGQLMRDPRNGMQTR
jgi:hypothetical protein